MVKLVKHSKVSTIPDGDDSSLVRPSDWNADHDLSGIAESGTNTDITSLTGITGGISSPDFIQLDTAAAASIALAKLRWNVDNATAAFGIIDGTTEVNIGQQMYAYVTNAEATTITAGQAVYLYQATGNRASVKLASNLGDSTSAKTLGLVTADIAAGATGFVTTQGVLSKLDTSAFTEGATLYLGATAGSWTATKPKAPNHLVYLGVVERSNAGNGQIYVRPQNGYELDEIHDVQITSPANGQTILYDASTSLWKNANLTAGTGVSVTNGASSVTIANTGVTSAVAGTGISVSGATGAVTVTNTAPDQTVALTAGTGISTTGTYPNFTVTNTAPDQVVSLTGAGSTTVTGTYPSFTISSTGGTGGVTSVGGTGTVSGISLSGTVTSTGNLTLGGTLDLSSPPTIGNTTPNTIAGTNISSATAPTNTVPALALTGTPNSSTAGKTGVLGVGSNFTATDKNIMASFVQNINDYTQVVIQNPNAGTAASADFIVNNDNTTGSGTYGDFGINSSGFTGSGAFNTPNATYLYSNGGDLSLGTNTANAIHFIANNSVTDAMTISSAGVVSLGTALALTSGGTGKTTAPAAMANLMGFTTQATGVTLTNASSFYQVFTGSAAVTVTLPATSTLAQGWSFHIVNNTTNIVTVQTSTSVVLDTLSPGSTLMPTVLTTSGNTAADWEVGYTDLAIDARQVPQNAQTGNYTLTFDDVGKHIYHASGAGAAVYTIPANSAVPFEIGTTFTFINMSTTAPTIAITTDTMYLAGTGTTGTRTLANFGMATAIKMTATTWMISGSGLT